MDSNPVETTFSRPMNRVPSTIDKYIVSNPQIRNGFECCFKVLRRTANSTLLRVLYTTICIGMFITQVSLGVISYLKYSTRTEISTDLIFFRRLPTLSVSNNNRYRKSFLLQWIKDHEAKLSIETTVEYMLEKLDETNEKIPGNVLEKSGHALENMIVKQEGPVYYSKTSWLWSFKFGNGFVMEPNDTYDEEVDREVLELDICKLWMDFESNELLDPQNMGGRVAIHDKDFYPDFYNDAVPIEPRQKYYIRIYVEKTKFLPLPYWTACRNYSGDTKDRNQERCINRCITRTVVKACGCLEPSVFEVTLSEENAELKCTGNKTKDFFKLYLKRNREEFWKCEELCAVDCESSTYSQEFFKLPILNTSRNGCTNRKRGNCSQEDSKPNKTRLKFLWKSYIQKNIEYVPDIKLNDLLASIGGFLGLWMGISLLNLPRASYGLATFIFRQTTSRNVTKNTVKNV